MNFVVYSYPSLLLLSILLLFSSISSSSSANTESHTNKYGYKVESNLAIRELFTSVLSFDFPKRLFDRRRRERRPALRLIPVGDFEGISEIKEALYSPFHPITGLFIPLRVYETWNVDGITNSEFLISIESEVKSSIPTTSSRIVNITYQGTATFNSHGKIQALYLYLINIYEQVILNGTLPEERVKLIEFIQENQQEYCQHLPTANLTGKIQGSWTAIGKEDSVLCRAYFSSFVAFNDKYCQALASNSNQYCKDEVQDIQWKNIRDFYRLEEVPLLKYLEELGHSYSELPEEKEECDSDCQEILEFNTQFLYAHSLWDASYRTIRGYISMDGLFTENATGRIVPVGIFSDAETNKEYFVGLVSTNSSHANRGFLLMNKATKNFQVMTHVLIETMGNPTAIPPTNPTNLSELIIFQFNKKGQIVSYDASISELGSSSDPYNRVRRIAHFHPEYQSLVTNYNHAATVNAYISQICSAQAFLCTGSNQQWTSMSACVTDLQSRRFGSWNDIEEHDDIICRQLHLILVAIRPNPHCFHVGPTGGGKCVDKPKSAFYDGFEFDGAVNLDVTPSCSHYNQKKHECKQTSYCKWLSSQCVPN